MPEDREILALFFARSEQAITALWAKYGVACGRIAGNILKNPQDAEECVSDALLAAWNAIPPEAPDPLKAYIFRIVRNIAIAKYHHNTAAKRNSFYDAALEELEDCLASDATPEGALEERELSRQIDRFLDGLEPESRVLFVRRYWYGDSIGALALRFHTGKHNISVRLSRLRERLKTHLKREGYTL